MVNLSDLHRANDVLWALVFDKVLFSKHTCDPLLYFYWFPQLKQAPKSKITAVFPHHSGNKNWEVSWFWLMWPQMLHWLYFPLSSSWWFLMYQWFTIKSLGDVCLEVLNVEFQLWLQIIHSCQNGPCASERGCENEIWNTGVINW